MGCSALLLKNERVSGARTVVDRFWQQAIHIAMNICPSFVKGSAQWMQAPRSLISEAAL